MATDLGGIATSGRSRTKRSGLRAKGASSAESDDAAADAWCGPNEGAVEQAQCMAGLHDRQAHRA